MNRHKGPKIQRPGAMPYVMLFMQHNSVHIALRHFFTEEPETLALACARPTGTAVRDGLWQAERPGVLLRELMVAFFIVRYFFRR